MEDQMSSLAEDITDFNGDESGSTATTATVFGYDYTVTASYQPRGSWRLSRVVVDVVANDDEVGTMTITRFGTSSRRVGEKPSGILGRLTAAGGGELSEKVPIRGRLYGNRGNTEGAEEYLAFLLRELCVESHNKYIGARDDFPGIRVEWDTIWEAGKFARDYKRGDKSLSDLASPSNNPFL